jgi:predicted nucleotidyltransferase
MPGLDRMPPEQRLVHAGPAVQAIVRAAVSTIAPQRVFLFGSRATGAAHPLSDIDLAFVVGSPEAWGEFAAWVQEDAPTLLDIDLIDLAHCSKAIRDAVMRNGILIYERTN